MLPHSRGLDKTYVNAEPGWGVYTLMKLFAATLAFACLTAGAVVPPPPPTVPVPKGNPEQGGLRQALHDFFRKHASVPPRQLSPDERAELRRQLSQYGRPPERHP